MRQRAIVGIALFLSVVTAPAVLAQQDNPTQDLINLGRRAFDDLDFRAADSIARMALNVPGLKGGQRIQALELAAAARYPASERDRHADSALIALRSLARMAPGAAMPATLTWPGLDSLFAVARGTTFGASVSVPDSAEVQGVQGRVTLNVVASRPAMFSLRIARTGDSGLGELVDSIGPIERGSVRFMPVQADLPRYSSGTYRLTIIATDPGSGERVDLVMTGIFRLPAVELQHIPVAHDRTELRVERTTPSRVRSIASAFLIGGFIYAAEHAYRSDSLKARGVPVDPRATTWAIGLGVSTAALSWHLDRGRTIEPNVAFNATVRKRWADEDAAAVAANEQARMLYRGTVHLTLEDM